MRCPSPVQQNYFDFQPFPGGIMPMRTRLRLFLVFLSIVAAVAQAAPMTFVHLAGSRGGKGFEDGPAADARFWEPLFIAADAAGNLYVTDRVNATVRKILPSGEVRTLAGLADARGTTDGKGAAARLWNPLGVAVDSHGNVFVVENEWKTIRKITPAGEVTTFAGTPDSNGAHADGFRGAAHFTYPGALAIDGSDNLYVGDSSRIRKITPDGNVTTLAGNGTHAVLDATGTAAEFFSISGMAWDPTTNSLVLNESQNSVVRRVTLPGAVVTTIAGQNQADGHVNANGTDARFQALAGITVAPTGYIWVSESNGSIRTISPSGDVADLAGGYFLMGAADGTGSAARFLSPFGMTISPLTGGIYVCDNGNRVVRALTGATVTTFAGTLPNSGIANGGGAAARFNAPSGLAVDSVNSLVYVADKDNHAIRRVTLPAGDVTTFAGSGVAGFANGNGTAAVFYQPQGVALDPSDGSLFVADTGNNCIRRIAMNGDVTTYAGNPNAGPGSTNGDRLTAARFYGPDALAFDPPRHRLIVADGYNHKLRLIDIPTGTVADVVRASDFQPIDFGGMTVDNVAVDASGNLYVGWGNRITKITPAGVVSNLAGPGDNNAPLPGAYDGTGVAARFLFPGPSTIAIDGSGNGFVADIWANTIRSITSGGVVQTVGGLLGRPGSADGTGNAAMFGYPRAVARYGDGVIVADEIGLRISVAQLPDTISAPSEAPIGLPIQLGTSPQTATSWQWTVIRRPAGSAATFSSATSATPTFTPDVPDVYMFRVVATGPSGTSITTTSVNVTQTLHHFRISPAGGVVAGNAASVAVQAEDLANNAMGFTGAVHFTSNDPNATLPGNYTFIEADNGGHTFAPVFRRAGLDSFTATEAGGTVTGSGQLDVAAAPASALTLTAASPASVDTPATVIVTARDSFGNAAASYTGTVHFTSTEAFATLPADYTFTGTDGGTKITSATLRRAGTYSVGVYDVAAPGPLHASANVIVTAPYVVGDIDHNGSSDLYWRNYSNGTNAVWLLNGASLSGVVDLPALPNPSYRIEAVADFDRDGEQDIVWRNYTTGANAIWLMNGSVIKTTVNLPALPNPDYHIAGAGDFGGDSGPDILWRNWSTGANAVWVMTGTAFSSIANLPALPNPEYHLEGAGDFNNDGAPDILWRNWTTGANALWLMNGGTSLGGIVNLPALPNPQYRIGAVGDYDGDRKVDIVWRNANSGANAMWKMNRLVFETVINLPALPNPAYEMAGAR
jgi:sugar lactone lactonase YvrE